MAGLRLSMRHVREILRQKWCLGRSHREVAASLGVSLGVVSGTLARAREAGLGWAEIEGQTELEVEARLYRATRGAGAARPLPDFAAIHTERQRQGVTLQLLHVEYLERHPDGYRYTQFCDYYRRWCRKHRFSMRQVHRAGEKLFVNYAGKKPQIVDRETGEVQEVELFVAVLGASSYTYAEASRSQRVPDFLASHTRALEFFGGATALTISDQLKSGVTRACRYEPDLQRSYAEWAEHYGTVLLPARPRKPRDKAVVEVAVQVAERWILARLRHETFFSLSALNARIRELLRELNDRPMRAYGQSRRERFLALNRPALRPLPAERFVFAEWKKARVNTDYHVVFEKHYYSVPHPLVHERLEVRATATTVEILHRGQRVAAHRRSRTPGSYTTDASHMPKSHRAHLEWIRWAETIGPKTAALVEAILEDRPHPEQGYRSCLGILRLAREYGAHRLEPACARAGAARARSYRHVASILRNGLDRQPWADPAGVEPRPRGTHENVRSGGYYH